MYMKGELQNKWAQCLEIIRENIGDGRTRAWFSPTKPKSFVDNVLTLIPPSTFYPSGNGLPKGIDSNIIIFP